MSGLAMFGLKDSSLLQFDHNRNDEVRRHNLQTLYGIGNAPCDSQLRTALDPLDPKHLRPAFRAIQQELQVQGILEEYRFLGKYLVSIDGTSTFGSKHVHCKECCQKTHRDGVVEYYHQLLAAVIVHPDKRTVLPFYPEAITKQDGTEKNDCEHNASKRLIPLLREEYPRRDFIILQDALACNGPHIKLLKEHDMSFIITAKPEENSCLLKAVIDGVLTGEAQESSGITKDGYTYGYRYINGVPLNHSHPDIRINFIDYWEERPNKTTFMHACITDIVITADNVKDISRAGRSRWKVENETFNTLKNLGYNLEHNYGHGEQHLSTVFAILMILAFLLDQVQETCCQYFQAARDRCHSRIGLWQKIRALFNEYLIDDWETLFKAIIWGHKAALLTPKGYDTG